MTHFAQHERHALCDLFLHVGPGAPTLCEGWTAADLAAHLVIRERRPDAAPGMALPPLAAYTERVQRATRDKGRWEDLVARVRGGPPPWLRPLDEIVNTVEFFVHHEDVRRAAEGWEARDLEPGMEAVLWARLKRTGRLLGRKSPTGLSLDAPGFGTATVKTGGPRVTVRGAPGELVLMMFGRGAASNVDFEGDQISVERVRHARLGL